MSKSPSEILFNGLPIIDVRSPSEHAQGHVPGAFSLPLFSDDERKDVGTMYKAKNRSEAVDLGLKFVEPRLEGYIEEAQQFAPNRELNMYCWRGGMRSGSLAWLLRSAGFKVNLIEGGYKAWRNEVMHILARPYKFLNLGGLTGVGKTDILEALISQDEQVVNLEGIAAHTGSAFNSHQTVQPSTEHFENLLAQQLLELNFNKEIWIEDESKAIGKVYLNHDLYLSKVAAPFILLSRPKEERVKLLCDLYSSVSKDVLKHSFQKIKKRIGGQYLNVAIQYLDEGDLVSAARIALRYYDKAYMYSMSKHNRIPAMSLSLKGRSANWAAEQLISWKNSQTNLFD